MVSIDEPADLLGVSVAQLVEGDGTEPGIVHVGRDRERSVRRSDRSRHEALAPVLALGEQRRLASKPRAFAVQLIRRMLEAVVGLRDRGARKGVGLDDIRARAEVVQVDRADVVRAREDQQVVVALQSPFRAAEALTPKILFRQAQLLDLGAEGAVHDEDALRSEATEGGGDLCAVRGTNLAHAAALATACGRRPKRWQIA
jgi:hypothetical protein